MAGDQTSQDGVGGLPLSQPSGIGSSGPTPGNSTPSSSGDTKGAADTTVNGTPAPSDGSTSSSE